MNVVRLSTALLVAAVILAACAPGAQQSNANIATTTVQRGNLTVTVSSSGTVEPAQRANLQFGTTGTIERILVQEGQSIKQGDEIASLDPRDLDQQVIQSEANLKTAQAQLEQSKTGNSTEQDVKAQQAAVDSAKAQLQKARTGGTTAADIANAQAAVRIAEAGLTKAKTGNIAPADIAAADAALRSAQAQLDKAKQGPKPDQVSAAQTALQQAKDAYQKTASQASTTKTSAEKSMNQAADDVRLAQEARSTAFWDNEQAKSGKDPKSGQSFADVGLDEDVQKRQYEDALKQADLKLSQAQSRLDQAKLTFENAKQAEINDVATAQGQVNDAQVKLDELLKGPDEADVRVAQAAYDQAKANLDKLKAGGTPADVATAQAQLDQARAQLRKLQQGGTQADVAAAQAGVTQSEAQLEKLSSGASQSDISIAEAAVTQADAQLKAAQLNRDKATLKAPFSGVVTAVGVTVGDQTGAAGADAPFVLVDNSKLHLDVNVSENDIAQIKSGQAAGVTIDALGTQAITGTVSYIAPAATTTENVTTYKVRVDLPQDNPAIKVGMTASVEIATAEQQGVLIVPLSAIRSDGSKRFVRVKRGEEFQEVEIKIGASNDIDAEVVSGLNEGDVIAEVATTPSTTR